MRRIVLLLMVSVLVVAMVAVSAVSGFAAPPSQSKADETDKGLKTAYLKSGEKSPRCDECGFN